MGDRGTWSMKNHLGSGEEAVARAGENTEKKVQCALVRRREVTGKGATNYMLARYTLRCFGCLAVDAECRVEEASQKVEQQCQAGPNEADQRMVHLLFFCFCWGSRRGFSTALGDDVSIRL